MPILRQLSCCVALTSALAAPALADDVTAEQAAQLQAALQNWSTLLGGTATGATGPQSIKITPDGDHFRIELLPPPAFVTQGVVADAPLETLQAKPLSGGRYELGGLTIPQPLKFTLTPGFLAGLAGADAAAKPGTAPNAPPGKPAQPAEPTVVEVTTKGQTLNGVLDPTLATASNVDSAITGLHGTANGINADVAEFVSHTSWTPAGAGLVNVIQNSSFSKVSVSGQVKTETPFAVFLSGGKFSNQVDGAPVGYAADMANRISALNSIMKRDPSKPMTAEQRKAAHDAVKAVDAAFVNQKSSATFDGFEFASGGISTDIAHTQFYGGFATESGKLSFSFGTTIEGLKSSAIPPGPMQDLVPQRVVLNPRIYGISRADAVALANHAIDADMKDPAQSNALQAEALALLSKGPVSVAIDQLVIEIPGSSLKGAATVEIPSPDNITAHALLTIDGLDDLIKKANSTPMLAQAAPGLIFLKGIGKADGNVTTWNVSYVGSKIMVNDTDLSAMIPGKQPPQPRPPQGQPRPRPPLPAPAPKSP